MTDTAIRPPREGLIMSKKIGDVPIWLDPSSGRFEAYLPGSQRHYRTKPISRRTQAEVEREILKRSSASIELLRRPEHKGRRKYGSEQRSYEPLDLYRELPRDRVTIVGEGSKDRYGTLTFRTGNGATVHGPFVKPNDELVAEMRALLDRRATETAAFEKEWDALVDRFEPVTDVQLTETIRASITAAKESTQE